VHLGELRRRAAAIKAVTLDGDGVLFTGRVFIDEKGERLKERSFVDGQGISLLRAAGVQVAFVTGETTDFPHVIADKLNKLDSAQSDAWQPIEVFTGRSGQEKVDAIKEWLCKMNLMWEECAHMGDDLPDYEILQKVGFPAAPAQAEKVIKNICVFVTERRGGDGAIRDLVNFILMAKEIDQTKLSLS